MANETATLFLIDKIEGNSNIGVPVFSRQALKQNFEFLALAPQKKIKINQQAKPDDLLHPEIERFRIAQPPNKAPVTTGTRSHDSSHAQIMGLNPAQIVPKPDSNSEMVMKVMSDVNNKVAAQKQADKESKTIQSGSMRSKRDRIALSTPLREQRTHRQTAAFVATTREELDDVVIKKQQQLPATGFYHAKYSVVDKHNQNFEYSKVQRHDKLKRESINRKNRDFEQKTKLCQRIRRSLVSPPSQPEIQQTSHFGSPRRNTINEVSFKLGAQTTMEKRINQPLISERSQNTLGMDTARLQEGLTQPQHHQTAVKKSHQQSVQKPKHEVFSDPTQGIKQYEFKSGPMFKQIVNLDLDKVQQTLPMTSRSFVGFQKQTSREKNVPKTPVGANPARFDMPDNFDKSHYLTTNRNPQLILSFARQANRDKQELTRAGDFKLILGKGGSREASAQQDYETGLKERFSFPGSLQQGVPKLATVQGRSTKQSGNAKQSDTIYSVKMNNTTADFAQNKESMTKSTKPRCCTLIDLKKQSRRDMTATLRTTDAYANICRDNERANLLKHLLLK